MIFYELRFGKVHLLVLSDRNLISCPTKYFSGIESQNVHRRRCSRAFIAEKYVEKVIQEHAEKPHTQLIQWFWQVN